MTIIVTRSQTELKERKFIKMKRKKINTIAGAVKKDFEIQNCDHAFGEIKTDRSSSSLAGFQYRTCTKCGLREFSSELLNSIKETRPPDVVKVFNEDGEQVR